MTPRTPPPDSPLWVGAGAAVTGLATYALLVVVARALGAAEYGAFSIFWSLLVLAGFGAFLPVEQVLTRRRAAGGSVHVLLTSSIGTMAVTWGGTLVVLAVVVLVSDSVGARDGLLPLSVAVSGFALQFPARGILAGGHRLRGYALVVAADAVLRVVLATVLWLADVRTVLPYALAVAGSAIACGVGAQWAVRSRARDGHGGDGLIRETAGLTVAMLGMQLLLNSPVIVASLLARDAVMAGHLLAVTALARLPVFVVQAGQASYIGRTARAAHGGDASQLRRLVRLVAAAVGGLAALTVLCAALVGPWAVRLLFGAEFEVTRTLCVLVAAGIGVFLLASVANDLTVALDRHAAAGAVWLAGAGIGAGALVVLDDVALQATVPLLVGALAALCMIVPRLVVDLRSTS